MFYVFRIVVDIVFLIICVIISEGVKIYIVDF